MQNNKLETKSSKAIFAVITIMVIWMITYTFIYMDKQMGSEESLQREAQKNQSEFIDSVERGHIYEVVTEGNAILAITIDATTYRPNSITIKEYPEFVNQTDIVRNMSPNEAHYKVDNFKNNITVYYVGGIEEFIKKFSKKSDGDK